jgi:hypothetical protein
LIPSVSRAAIVVVHVKVAIASRIIPMHRGRSIGTDVPAGLIFVAAAVLNDIAAVVGVLIELDVPGTVSELVS